MFCVYCGAKNPDDALICRSCGKRQPKDNERDQVEARDVVTTPPIASPGLVSNSKLSADQGTTQASSVPTVQGSPPPMQGNPAPIPGAPPSIHGTAPSLSQPISPPQMSMYTGIHQIPLAEQQPPAHATL